MNAGGGMAGGAPAAAANAQDGLSPPAESGWLIPDWPAPEGVRAVCTTRAGGVSRAPYDTLNLGDHVGDAPADVAANRARLAQVLGVKPVYLQQVHGRELVELRADTPHGTAADACGTRERGLACTIMVADCLPVLFTDARGTRVAAAHAGWRGLAGGVLQSAVASFAAPPDAPPMAWLGPCIGPGAFEVGDEVKAAFEAQDAHASTCFVPAPRSGKWLADLPALARQQLMRLGVTQVHGNDGSDAWCTVRNASRFFSHRRDRVSGRFAAAIWRR